MKNVKYLLKLNSSETDLVVRSLVDLRNSLVAQGRYHDCVDEIIIKIAKSRVKKFNN